MPKFRYCQFCGVDDSHFEGKFCSILCADLWDDALFWGVFGPGAFAREFTVAQKVEIFNRIQGIPWNEIDYDYVRKKSGGVWK